MTFAVRKTAEQPPMKAAVAKPGVIYECNERKPEVGWQWAAFFQRGVAAHITYRETGPWRVHVLHNGRTKHSSATDSYTIALVTLQEELSKAGASPSPAPLVN